MMTNWEMVIGIEVHAQITSASKLFSGANASFGGTPNSHVSLVDAAMPGMLPVVNRECVRQAIRAGLALGAEINRRSVFARKNYFYPDLPQGYQISQFEEPIVGKGSVTIDFEDGSQKQIGIHRAHLEQDAGKSLHDQKPGCSLVDLNRSGVALLEIVSDPDLRSGLECSLYVSKLRSILRAVGVCDGNMAEGSLRADVNLSIREKGSEVFGTRTEMKNLNSVRFIRQAVEVEANRQIAIIESGGEVLQETRLFDPAKGETRAMRTKEGSHDYRYFPCPDLPPLCLEEDEIEAERKNLPELPDVRKQRFIKDYNLDHKDAAVLSEDGAVASYFETAAKGRDSKLVANWMLSELFAVLNREEISIENTPIEAERLGSLVAAIASGRISGKIGKQVFAIMLKEKTAPDAIIAREGLEVVSDTSALESIIDELMAANSEQVESYRAGKDKVLGWFVGQVMKATKGTAAPDVVNKLLQEKLKSS